MLPRIFGVIRLDFCLISLILLLSLLFLALLDRRFDFVVLSTLADVITRVYIMQIFAYLNIKKGSKIHTVWS